MVALTACELHNSEIPICLISNRRGCFFVILNKSFLQLFVTRIAERNMTPYLLCWFIAIHLNSFLTGQVTPPHPAIRSWTQLLIAGRLNLVCHQIPLRGRDGDVVQKAARPPHRQRLTPTEASSGKWQQKLFFLTSFGTLTPLVQSKLIGWQLGSTMWLHPKCNCFCSW